MGFRVARGITPRVGVEFTLDASQGRARFTDRSLAGIEATRASFVAAVNERTGLLATGGGVVFINPAVSSTATIEDDRGRQLFTAGTLIINLAKPGRLVPYAAVGAGVISNRGDLPQATVAGTYRFDSLGALSGYFPVNESDTASVRVVAARQHPLAAVVGGGVKFHHTRRGGFRADVRASISKNTMDVMVDATPRVVTTSQPLGAIASNLSPSIQFSNLSTVNSTLSGPQISGFKTFTSQGTAVHVALSAGYFVRF